MATITKPLVYVGTATEVNNNRTSLVCALMNDMDGISSNSFENKTKFWLHYGSVSGSSDSTPDTYYFPLIDAGTLIYYHENNLYGSAETYGFVYVIDHGDGLKTHYASGDKLKFSNGTVIGESSVGTVLPAGDYLYWEPAYWYGFPKTEAYVAIESNGAFINPRSIAAPDTIPALTNYSLAPYPNLNGKFAFYVNPFNLLDNATSPFLIGNADSPFHSENGSYNVIFGETFSIKESFWNSLPVQYQNTATVKIDYVSWEDVGGTINYYISRMSWTIDGQEWYYLSLYNLETTYSPKTIVSIYGQNTQWTYATKTGSDIPLGTYAVTQLHLRNKQPSTAWQLPVNWVLDTAPIWSGGGSGEFIPDDGTKPDTGGGNQNWGQGNSSTSTTGGTFDNTSDTVSTGIGTSTKAGQAYNNYYVLNLEHIFNIKHEIWSLSLPGLTRPSDAIISLLLFPFDLTSMSFSTEQSNIKIGNSVMPATTEGVVNHVNMLNANFDNIIDFGSFKLEPYFGGFQDYAPYTKIQIYLPFIGIRDLDPSYVQGKTINVKYYVNFTNGSCVACIYSDNYIYTRFNGQLAQSVPLTQVNNSLVEATIGTALQTAASVAASSINPALGIGVATSALSNIAAAKPSISSSAGGGGECELSLPLQSFLIIERPQCAIPQTYNHEKGRPSLVNKKLSNCKGFTQMSNPQLTAKCTSEENDMINNLLKNGVIING